MNKAVAFLAILLMVAAVPSVVHADSPWTMESSYLDKTVGKLEFGFKNAAGGWTELITEPVEHFNNNENIVVGLGKGAYNAVVYTVGGLIHLVTVLVPVDVPIPDNGISFS